MKKIIGVVPSSSLGDMTKSCMSDHYKVGNNYTKRITEAGCVPVGMTPVDDWLSEEALELCDGFVVQGGAEFYPYHFQVIHHAITHGKRYLGICLGSQLIYVYFVLRKMVEERGYEGDLVKAICDLRVEQGPEYSVLRKVPDHRSGAMTRGGEDAAKHDVNVVPGTLLHRVTGKNTLRAASFHYLNTPPTQTLVPINAWSAKGDGVVEGVEYGENILGVQYHPEVDDLLPELFDFLTGKEYEQRS